MSNSEQPGRAIEQGYAGLNKLFEHRSRLAICALLARFDRISFSRFKELLKESDGNLGAQLRKLEDAGYVDVKKEFIKRRPVTWYSISSDGHQALQQHLHSLETIVGAGINQPKE